MGLGFTALKKIPGKIFGYLWDNKLKIFIYSLLTATLTTGGGLYANHIYQVKTGEGYILTEKSGNRVSVTKEGWYYRYPLVTGLEGPIKLFNQSIYFDGKEEPHETIAQGDYVLNASGVTFIEIVNLYQFAVLNVNSKKMLQNKLDSIIGYHLRRAEPDALLHSSDAIAMTIEGILKSSTIEKDFGVKIKSFNLLKTALIDKVVQANAEKQGILAKAEGRLEETRKDITAINEMVQARANEYKTLENEFKPQTPEEKVAILNYITLLRKYQTMDKRAGDNTWITSEGEGRPLIGLNSNKGNPELKKRIKDLEDLLKSYESTK